MLIFQNGKYIQIPFFPTNIISGGSSKDAVGLMMVVTLCLYITFTSLRAVQTLLAAFKTAPQIRYGD